MTADQVILIYGDKKIFLPAKNVEIKKRQYTLDENDAKVLRLPKEFQTFGTLDVTEIHLDAVCKTDECIFESKN